MSRVGRTGSTLLLAGTMAALLATGPAAIPVAAAPSSLNGTVFLPDGRPASGVPVTLTRDISPSDAILGFLATVFSLGIACVTRSVQICKENSATVTTSADGKYAVQFKTTTSFGNPASFSLSASLPAAATETRGPNVSARFKVTSTNGTLPELRFWHPAVAYSGDARTGKLAFDRLPSGYGGGGSYTVRFVDGDGASIWDFGGAGPGQEVDARLLEDSSGSMSVATSGSSSSASFSYTSQAVPYSGSAGPPLSRGSACVPVDSGGHPLRQDPCGLTDGDLGRPYALPDRVPVTVCPQGAAPIAVRSPSPGASPTPCPPQRPYVDLGSSRYISLVVLHGCATCGVELSDDASHWRPAVASGGQVHYPAGTRARYVRVSGDPRSLHEVSAWQGDPPPEGIGGFFSNLGGGNNAGASGRGGGVAIGILVALVALMVAGAAFVVGRSRHGGAAAGAAGSAHVAPPGAQAPGGPTPAG